MCKIGGRSPWGVIDGVTPTQIDDITWVDTPGHGGCHVGRVSLAKMRTQYPALAHIGEGPWFEEDSAWSAVYGAFPSLAVSADELEHARKTLMNWYPDEWVATFGGILTPRTSYVLQQREFKRQAIGKYRAVTAVGAHAPGATNYTEFVNVPPGMVGVFMVFVRADGTEDGNNRAHLLVPQALYRQTSNFLVDPANIPEGVIDWPRKEPS